MLEHTAKYQHSGNTGEGLVPAPTQTRPATTVSRHRLSPPAEWLTVFGGSQQAISHTPETDKRSTFFLSHLKDWPAIPSYNNCPCVYIYIFPVPRIYDTYNNSPCVAIYLYVYIFPVPRIYDTSLSVLVYIFTCLYFSCPPYLWYKFKLSPMEGNKMHITWRNK